MPDGGFVSYDGIDFKAILSKWRCPCCNTAMTITEEEKECLKKAVKRVENISGFCKGPAGKQDD